MKRLFSFHSGNLTHLTNWKTKMAVCCNNGPGLISSKNIWLKIIYIIKFYGKINLCKAYKICLVLHFSWCHHNELKIYFLSSLIKKTLGKKYVWNFIPDGIFRFKFFFLFLCFAWLLFSSCFLSWRKFCKVNNFLLSLFCFYFFMSGFFVGVGHFDSPWTLNTFMPVQCQSTSIFFVSSIFLI